jgi:hypothetical protein
VAVWQMAINWNAAIWRGLAAEARTAARKVSNGDLRLQILMVAGRCDAKAMRAERTERDEQRDRTRSRHSGTFPGSA